MENPACLKTDAAIITLFKALAAILAVWAVHCMMQWVGAPAG